MKPIHQHFIAATLMLLFAFQASAQTPIDVTFTPATSNVAVGATVAIQLKVVNFKNIGSFQFPITFNQNVLQLLSVTSPATALAPFNTTLTLDPNGNNVFLNPGRLAVSWQSNPNTQPNGVTLAANASMFTLNFKVLTDCSSAINIAGPPVQPNLEVTTATGSPVTVNFQNGGATITAGTCGSNPPPPVTAIYGFHIIANTIFIPPGEIGCMPVTANDFEGIQSALYAMYWDAPTLELVGTRNYGLPGTIDFGVNNPLGRLATSWGTPNGLPVTRPDLSTLYEVCYRAEGPAGANTLVIPNGNGFQSGTNAEVINANGMDIWKDTTGIKDTIFIVSNPAPATAVTYSAEKDTVIAGQTTCVDLRLKNFSNATYGEFAMTYDTTKLRFSSLNLGSNPLGLSLADTATNNFVKFFSIDVLAPNGEDVDTLRYIHFSYRKTTGAGTVADNTVPFSVCFKAIGPANTTTDVNITSYFNLGNALVPIGAAKKTIGSVPVAAVKGSVFIKSATTLSATATVAQNVSCANGNNGSINLAVNNCTGTATYLWSGPGITNNNNTLKDQVTLPAGTYSVTVTCSVGGTTTASATVSQPSAITLPVPTMTPVTCNGGSDGAISIAPSGGNPGYTYLWSGPAGFTSTNQNITGLKVGPYKVTITDNSGCSVASSNQTLTGASAIVINTGTATMVNVKCKGGSDGAITIADATGGNAGAYSYAWTGPGGFTASTKNISGLKAGAYTVMVTDSKGCTSTIPSPLQITEPTQLAFSPTPVATPVKCLNGTDGSIQFAVTGGTTGYTTVWKNVATGTVVDPTALAAGTYAATVTDANQCTTTTGPIAINAPSTALTVSESHTDAACSNSPTGSITLSISGGWNNPGVTWNPALPPIPNPTNILPNTYTATITDAGGCVITTTVTVNSAAVISLNNATVITNVKCHGEANGGIVIAPIGGGAGGAYDVQWNTGLSGLAISGLAGGNYTPTVTNTNSGCTAVFPAITVSEPSAIQAPPVVTMQTGGTNNGKIKLNVSGGTPSYQYNWSGPGGFSATAVDSITGLAAGDYFVTITDANLCIYTATINVPADNPISLTATVKNACDNDGCITVNISANATATPFVLSWGGATPVVTSDHSAAVCGLAPGVYNITVSDAAGHSSVLPAQTVTQLDPATVGSLVNQPVDEMHNGSIELQSSGAPLTYMWNTGSNSSTIFNLDSGTYVVLVKNAVSLCTKEYSFHLNRTYPAVVTSFSPVLNPTCANSATGAITLNFSGANGDGQGGGYTFAWTGPNGFTANTKNISNLVAGTYTVTVTDQTPTTFTYSQTLTATSQLAVTNVTETSLYPGGYQVSGATPCDGKATVAYSGASGAASILWSNGVTTANNTTLCGGAYAVTVTDALGCSSVWSDSLTAPASVQANWTVIAPVSCHGECDGIAQLYATGGVAPYTVRWALPGNQFQQDQLANSSAFSIVDNLCGGDYKVTVTDGNGVTTLQTVPVPDAPAISATFSQNLPSRFNSCDGETIIEPIGASGPITYSWSGSNSHSGTEARADGLCAGEIVTFTIVDARGCSAVAQDTIAYPKDGCLLGSPVITPGQKDGKNDELFITCAETLNNTVEIFNRWGQLVYSVKNYDNNGVVWTGETKSGAALPEGVYFYVMTYTDTQGTEQRIKGYVNLLR